MNAAAAVDHHPAAVVWMADHTVLKLWMGQNLFLPLIVVLSELNNNMYIHY